jgi:hypothetical protein
MTVVNVGIVRVGVAERRMNVWVRVRLGRIHAFLVLVLVVLVVDVSV